jgi:hypothetical protein
MQQLTFNPFFIWIFICIFILTFQSSIVFSYLDNNQWAKIHSVLIHKEKYAKFPEHIQKINNIIYFHYSPLAIKYARQFKQFHYYKCKEIPQQELNLYAFTGLSKAVTNYQPSKYENAYFFPYAKKYITGELYLGMSELQPLTIVPKSERKKSIFYRNKDTIGSSISLIGDDEYLVNQLQPHYQRPINKDYEYFWSNVETANCSLTTKQMIHLKFSYDCNKIRSNQKIADMLGCSEEHVRQQLRAFFNTFFIYF